MKFHPTTIFEDFFSFLGLWRRQKLPIYLLAVLCLNAILAPAVFAATAGALSPAQSYWVAALILLTIALAIYLFFVMFYPERF